MKLKLYLFLKGHITEILKLECNKWGNKLFNQ